MKKIIRKNTLLIATILSILVFVVSIYIIDTERYNDNIVMAICVATILTILSGAWNIYYTDYLKKTQNDNEVNS